MSQAIPEAITRAGAAVPSPGLAGWAERGWLPDAAIRSGIRALCRRRLQQCRAGGVAEQQARVQALAERWRDGPIAVETDAANRQHYEVPAAFFQHCLGPRLKYSACLFEQPDTTLEQAEKAMLTLYAQRAQLADGMDILDLGCGWGSLTLWLAERYPRARITGVSNSQSQRAFILARARERGLANVRILTADVNTLSLPDETFDRCLSIEMFEHLRNHGELMARISRWLRPGGRLFVHVFAHRVHAYPFQTDGPGDWMGRHFFTGGLMPAADTFLQLRQPLQFEQRWLLDGHHYARTAEAWLANQDAARDALLPLLADTYGGAAAGRLWFQRWRMFWMACAELFAYDGGQEWLVAHYRFQRPEVAR